MAAARRLIIEHPDGRGYSVTEETYLTDYPGTGFVAVRWEDDDSEYLPAAAPVAALHDTPEMFSGGNAPQRPARSSR